MGTWGVDGFANDEALDWIERLDPRDGDGPVRRELRSIAEAPDPHLTAPRAAIALVAAELVAALHGQPHPELPPAARRWLDAQPAREATSEDDALVDATRALDFVVTGSQLSETWSQRTDDHAWRTALDDLRMRLAAAGGMRRVQ
jgi:hypothetical protein